MKGLIVTRCHAGSWPGQLWSLWDMLNFNIAPAIRVLAEVNVLVHLGSVNEDIVTKVAGGHKSPEVQNDPTHKSAVDGAKDEVRSTVKLVRDGFGYLKCPHIAAACDSLEWWITQESHKWGDLRMKAIAVRNAIQTELGQYLYYQYPRNKAHVLQSWEADWTASITAFPAIKADIGQATDLYALGQDVASVFYCMRILETGLAVMATDVGITFDVQQWQTIIDQIEARITAERKSLPKGAARNERLQFLSEAAKEFFYFKDGWRNYVSHGRANYDEHQALSVLSHVRAFMNHLASKLSETP